MPFLSFIEPTFAWNVPLVSLIFLKRSLVFPILLFSSIYLHWSLRKTFLSLLAILWNSAFKWEYLSFSPLLLASLLLTALPTKVRLVKAVVFPVVMYGCESWTVKKAKRWRIDAFELWCWRRLLRVPWTARRSNQSILKEISPECSLEGLMLKLKLQYFGHLTQRVDSGKDPDAGRDWGQQENGMTGDEMAGMASPAWWTWVWVNSGTWWWTGRPGVLWFTVLQRVGRWNKLVQILLEVYYLKILLNLLVSNENCCVRDI